MRNNKEAISTISSHKKTLTCVKFVKSGDRVFTSSLDSMLKVYSAEDFQMTHFFKFSSPINSFDLTDEATHFAVGLADGTVLIRKKNTNLQIEEDDEEKEQDNYKLPSFFKFFF